MEKKYLYWPRYSQSIRPTNFLKALEFAFEHFSRLKESINKYRFVEIFILIVSFRKGDSLDHCLRTNTSDLVFTLTKIFPLSVSKLFPSLIQPPLAKPKDSHFSHLSSFFKRSTSFLEVASLAMTETTITIVSGFIRAHANW